jgi:hypothetical protein
MSDVITRSRLMSERTWLKLEFSSAGPVDVVPGALMHAGPDDVELAMRSVSATLAAMAASLVHVGELHEPTAEIQSRLSRAVDDDLESWLREAEASPSKQYRRLVRLLKAWNRGSAAPRASLLFEVLAVTVQPRTWRAVLENVGPIPDVAVSLILPAAYAHATKVEPLQDIDIAFIYQGVRRAGVDIDRLTEAMTPVVPITPPPVVLQARRNAEARATLLAEFGALTSAQVAELAGSEAKNTSALAGRWRREGRVIAVEHHGATYYPGFQFDAEGRPKPVVADVLRHLAAPSMTPWQRALWFTTANGWLSGRRPVDVLDDEPEEVVAAARDALREPVG